MRGRPADELLGVAVEPSGLSSSSRSQSSAPWKIGSTPVWSVITGQPASAEPRRLPTAALDPPGVWIRRQRPSVLPVD
jgi:hypothetical protein